MARQTRPRTRKYKYEPHPVREPERYEPRQPERRPQPAAATQPRLGPYEFRYDVEIGYRWDNRLA